MGKNNTKEALKKKRNRKILIISVVLIIIAILVGMYLIFGNNFDETSYTKITFANFYETMNEKKNVSRQLQSLDGKKVLLKGYMAQQSPIDESFIYLVNQPYVVCPFCTLGDTTKLEVMSIYMADGTSIKFRNDPVQVYGTLEVAEKKDSFDYTTQFRIKADRIVTLKEGQSDSQVNAYYKTLNEMGMILDIQILQMNIDTLTNEDAIKNYYGKDTPVEIINAMKEETYYNENYGGNSEDGNGMKGYINYIKECPDIIASVDPVDEHLKKINEDLINLYNENIKLLEKVGELYIKIQTTNMSDDEKINVYNELLTYKTENLKLFDEFNNWNNELRK